MGAPSNRLIFPALTCRPHKAQKKPRSYPGLFDFFCSIRLRSAKLAPSASACAASRKARVIWIRSCAQKRGSAIRAMSLQILCHHWPPRTVADVENENVRPRNPVEHQIGILPQGQTTPAFGIDRNAYSRKPLEIVNCSLYCREHVTRTGGAPLFEIVFNADEITQGPGRVNNQQRPLRCQKALIWFGGTCSPRASSASASAMA